MVEILASADADVSAEEQNFLKAPPVVREALRKILADIGYDKERISLEFTQQNPGRALTQGLQFRLVMFPATSVLVSYQLSSEEGEGYPSCFVGVLQVGRISSTALWGRLYSSRLLRVERLDGVVLSAKYFEEPRTRAASLPHEKPRLDLNSFMAAPKGSNIPLRIKPPPPAIPDHPKKPKARVAVRRTGKTRAHSTVPPDKHLVQGGNLSKENESQDPIEKRFLDFLLGLPLQGGWVSLNQGILACRGMGAPDAREDVLALFRVLERRGRCRRVLQTDNPDCPQWKLTDETKKTGRPSRSRTPFKKIERL